MLNMDDKEYYKLKRKFRKHPPAVRTESECFDNQIQMSMFFSLPPEILADAPIDKWWEFIEERMFREFTDCHC